MANSETDHQNTIYRPPCAYEQDEATTVVHIPLLHSDTSCVTNTRSIPSPAQARPYFHRPQPRVYQLCSCICLFLPKVSDVFIGCVSHSTSTTACVSLTSILLVVDSMKPSQLHVSQQTTNEELQFCSFRFPKFATHDLLMRGPISWDAWGLGAQGCIF